MKIGEKIKKFRVAQGLSQKQLAIMSGMSEPAVRNYELGNRTPSFAQLERLAFSLKLSPYALADPFLENRHGVMQALFSMEDDFGLRPVEVDGKVMLCIDRNLPMKVKPKNKKARELFQRDKRKREVIAKHGGRTCIFCRPSP